LATGPLATGPMAMGPLAMADMAGIDVGWLVREAGRAADPADWRQPVVSDALYHQGRHGQKTGAGWYRYEEGDRRPLADPTVEELILSKTAEAGIERRDIDAREIVERTILPLINEGARLLGEGIAIRAVDIDIAYVYGYGFPAWRGGPMCYADGLGLDVVCERIRRVGERRGTEWRLAPLLEELAAAGGDFAGHDRSVGG